MLKARRAWNNASQALNVCDCQPAIIYPTKLPSVIKVKRKAFCYINNYFKRLQPTIQASRRNKKQYFLMNKGLSIAETLWEDIGSIIIKAQSTTKNTPPPQIINRTTAVGVHFS